jgi:hypothetical protein
MNFPLRNDARRETWWKIVEILENFHRPTLACGSPEGKSYARLPGAAAEADR